MLAAADKILFRQTPRKEKPRMAALHKLFGVKFHDLQWEDRDYTIESIKELLGKLSQLKALDNTLPSPQLSKDSRLVVSIPSTG